METIQKRDRDWEMEQTFARIMESRGVGVTIQGFHSAVNVTFHQFEAEVYNNEHPHMWKSLPYQIELLVDDCLAATSGVDAIPNEIRVLDVGCGTGLAADSLVHSKIGPRIKSLTLLDSSSAMLKQAKKLSASWNVPVIAREGTLNCLGTDEPFDWIIASSVLHHIPHLESFLRQVKQLQSPNAIFCHLQDPNGDHWHDPPLAQRLASRKRFQMPEALKRFRPSRIIDKISRELGYSESDDLVAKTNRALIADGIIATPLTAAELFAITDIHVGNNQGISISAIQGWMPEWKLLSERSYCFFGNLWSALPPKYRSIEESLTSSRSLDGLHIGATWQLASKI